MTPRKHAAEMHAFADGADIQFRRPINIGMFSKWRDEPNPAWQDDCEYRVKPAEPERVYPTTLMTPNELSVAFHCGDCRTQNYDDLPMVRLANAAIRAACEADQVVPMADVQEVARNLNKRRYDRAERALLRAGFTDHGGEDWEPPVGPKPLFLPFRCEKRDMAIAEAVRDACITVDAVFGGVAMRAEYLFNLNLPAIIATVK